VVWAVGIGLGAYFAGPPIEDAVSDLGWVITVGLVLLVLVAVWLELRRRLRRRGMTQPGAADGATSKTVPPRGGWALVAPASAEKLQHEQEYVEDVQAEHGVDDVGVRDGDEDPDQSEQDQGQ